VALLTVSDLEAAMGVTFSEAQVGRAEYLINGLTGYVQLKSGVSFVAVTGAVERFRASAYGRIKFKTLPINAVTTLHDYITNTDITDQSWYFDGIDEIRGLAGYQVVDVTYDYGLTVIPDDVKWAATEAVKRGMLDQGNTNLKMKQVGDVIYEYGGMFPLTDPEIEIFESYGLGDYTIKLDPSRYPYGYGQGYPTYPFDVTLNSFYLDGDCYE